MPTLIETTLAALALLFSGDAELWQVVGSLLGIGPRARAGAAAGPAARLRAGLSADPGALALALLHQYPAVGADRGDWPLALHAAVAGRPLRRLEDAVHPAGHGGGADADRLPVIATMAHAAFVQSDRRAWETARTLGLSWPRALLGLMRECRFGLLAAVIGAFSRIVTEVGCSMMVGATFCTSPATSPPPSRWRPRKGPSPRWHSASCCWPWPCCSTCC